MAGKSASDADASAPQIGEGLVTAAEIVHREVLLQVVERYRCPESPAPTASRDQRGDRARAMGAPRRAPTLPGRTVPSGLPPPPSGKHRTCAKPASSHSTCSPQSPACPSCTAMTGAIARASANWAESTTATCPAERCRVPGGAHRSCTARLRVTAPGSMRQPHEVRHIAVRGTVIAVGTPCRQRPAAVGRSEGSPSTRRALRRAGST